MNHVHIDYQKILNAALKGINKSCVFLGLGVNAADSPALREYHLTNDTNFRLLPESVPDDILDNWKAGLRLWIVAGGFRDLVDHLCVYLDKIYHVSSMIRPDLVKIGKVQFEKTGLDKKIRYLDAEFGITCLHNNLLASFYQVRNCFVHRLGTVGDEDLRNSTVLKLQYLHFVFVFIAEGGKTLPVPQLADPKGEPFQTQADGTIGIRFEVFTHEFKKGEKIILSPKTLTEILFFAQTCVTNYIKSAEQFASINGIPNKESDSPSPT